MTHLPVALMLGAGIWSHIERSHRTPHLMLLSTAVVLTFGLLYRYARQLYFNATFSRGLVKVTSSERFGSTMILQLELSREIQIDPGQYLYLTLVTVRALSFAQRHPFAIVWWETIVKHRAVQRSKLRAPAADDKSHLEAVSVQEQTNAVHVSTSEKSKQQYIWIMIDPQKGWTRRIAKHTDSLKGTVAWLDGPYGPLHRLHNFGCVLLFASGTGIFALLPYVKRLTELAMDTRATTRRIKLVWYTKEYHDQVKIWMQRLLDDVELDVIVGVQSVHTSVATDKDTRS